MYWKKTRGRNNRLNWLFLLSCFVILCDMPFQIDQLPVHLWSSFAFTCNVRLFYTNLGTRWNSCFESLFHRHQMQCHSFIWSEVYFIKKQTVKDVTRATSARTISLVPRNISVQIEEYDLHNMHCNNTGCIIKIFTIQKLNISPFSRIYRTDFFVTGRESLQSFYS